MPDNLKTGMIETFLTNIAKEQNQVLFTFCEEFVKIAKLKHQAEYKANHEDKAIIHSWLSNQNPPGLKFNHAISSKVLNPNSNNASDFTNWFCQLYQLEKKTY